MMIEESPASQDLAKKITGLAMKVHRVLGSGFLESFYVNALMIELQKNGIRFERERRFSMIYQGVKIGYFSADLVVKDNLIVETKAVESLAVIHSVQLVNYLAVARLEYGLLIDFGSKSLEFQTKTRVFNQTSSALPIPLIP